MFSLDPLSEGRSREDDFESAFESIEDTDLENESRETSPRNEEEVHLYVRNNEREIQSDRRVKDTLSEYSTFHGYKIQQSYDGAKVEAGLRVVRPQVGKYKSSDNFGVSRDIGTIVNVSDEGDVTVQWDMDESNVYSKRKNNQYALLLLDNAQTGIKHTYVECGGCNEYPLRGIRWKCFICANVNLCTRCYMDFRHDLGHRFKRMLSTNSTGVLMTTRNKIDWICAVGIMPTSVVQLRSNSQKTGKVIKFLETKIEAFRSNANVVWENPSKRQQYRVGTNGHCDLQFTTPAKGPMYYEDHLPVVTFENVKKGARVVRGPSWNDDRCDVGHGCVGTVTHVNDDQTNEETISKESSIKSTTQQGKKKVDVTLQVQWDNGKEMQLTGDLLRLFDNGPSGVEHVGYFCCCCPPEDKINIRGIRWKCTECTACDMCNICYMSNRHDERHKFQRIIDTNMREKMTTSRDDVKSSYRQSFGIFKGATVDEVAKVGKMKGGKIDEISNCHIDNGRSEVEVSWTNDETTTINRILDLKNNTGGAFHYYHSHLPALGNDNRSYFEVMFNFDGGSTKKIQIEIWRLVQQEKKLSLKPSLFLIFANHPKQDKKEDKVTLMEEVIDFARRTHLPCYVVGQRVCFHHGSTSTAFIHYKTEKDTVKELVKKGFRKFRRGDMIDKHEDEIHYFIRMTKYVIGETVLPVIISFRNGGITKDVLKSAVKSKIPVIRFKKHSLDVSVLTAENIDADACVVEMTENRTDIKNPWSVRKSYKRCYELGKYDGIDDTDEVAFISEIQSDFRHNLDALICYLIIGVSMTEESLVKKVFGRFTHVYPNALSMHLLKEGNWRIPKEHIKKYFNSRSIDYIYEEDMTSEIKKGLWSSLKSITNKAYTIPDYREDDIEDSDYNITLNQTELTDLMENTDPNLKITGCNVKLQVSTSELYGLIFLALLQKKYWLGAQQLIETGCIRIHHILIGCAILDDVADHWTTSPFLNEKLQRLKKAFTQRAIRITSCINDTDKKKEDFAIESKENYKKNKNQKELGDYINHAGRLLMNHGCIDDAVKTKNKMFLDNGTVKDILNKMWYDTEELDYLTILCFISLAAGHMLVLPLLMINMEARPLLWFYKKFKLPFMKVFMHMLGFLALLAAYAYMLLFDYSEDGITNTDYFIIFWMASFFVDENKQHIIAIIRKKWKVYANDWWNRLEWLSIMVYTTGMLLKLGEGTIFHHASKVLLVAAFVLFCIRILKLCCISAILGPKLVMIQKMFLDTLSFMIIMTVIMMCYNISFYALLYPNSEFSWRQIEKIIKNGYWMLFGELNLDVDILTEPDCTFNRTIYESGILQQCPTELGVYITPYLKAIYGLIAVILMLNLLIAMYSRTFSSIQQESELYWSQLQADFLEEYSIKTIFPIHLQLFVVPAIIIQAIVWFFGPYLNGELCQKCFEDGMDDESDQDDEFGEEATLNHCPMFVRVFLYNTNFDLKLKTTKEAEGNGALKAKGEIDIMEGDRITMLQKQLETSRKQQEKQNETKDRQHLKMITSKLQELEFCLNGIKKSLSTTENSNEKEENEDGTVRRARMSAESVRLSLSRSFDNC